MCYSPGCRKRLVLLEVWDREDNRRVVKEYCLLHVPSNKIVLVKAGR